MSMKPIAIAGASGFVGTSLRIALADKYQWTALTRSVTRVSHSMGRDNTIWRRCDLFSLPKVGEALKGSEKAIYMVHSMLPSNRLSQGDFRDMDLLLADNFIRGAEEAGVKHIVYISGLVPEHVPDSELSPHLASRLEVERILCSRSIPVTVLRTGVIFGPGGSSARMIINLVRRLPFMILPAWTENLTESIYIDDVIRAVDICLESDNYHGHYDIAGHVAMTYREMIQRTGKVLNKQTREIRLPANFVRLSRLWVQLFSGLPGYLVNPLLESLRHNLSAKPNPLLDLISSDAVSFEESVSKSIDKDGVPLPNPRQSTQGTDSKIIRKASRVRSVQRMPLPSGWTAPHITEEYAKWLQRITLGIIRYNFDQEESLSLFLFFKKFIVY